MNCPKCFEPLRVADRQGVEIDFCPECRGVWLDRGELDKIIDRTLQYSAAPPVDDYNEYGRSRGDHTSYKKSKEYKGYKDKKYYKKKKTKHFIEEIFDIFD